ncbi:MAG: WD40 repeat domain-containing protein [bacterium]|nr:WD40 repeat domain-containing protein [bacterium]
MYKKLVWVIMAVVFLGNIVTDSQSISEHPIITTDNASQVELLHVIGGGKILDILWSPDGESLFVANQKMVRLFNAQDLEETPILIDRFDCIDFCEAEFLLTDDFLTIVILQGEKLSSLSRDVHITFWDVITQRVIEDYAGDFDLNQLQYERQVLKQNSPDEPTEDEIPLHTYSQVVKDRVLNGDNTQIATVGHDSIVEIWDVETQTSRVIARNLGVSLSSVAFSPDSTKLAVGGWDGSLWIFDVATGELLQHFTEDWWVNWNITFNHDGSMLALGNDNNQVVVYDVVADYPFLVNRRVFEGHTNIVYGVDFHPNGTQLASASADGNIYIWDVATGTIVHTLTGSPFFDVDFHPDGTQLACASVDGYAIVAITSSHCQTETSNLGTIYSVVFSPDGTTFAYGDTTIMDLQHNQEPNLELDTLRAWSDIFTPFRSKLTFSDDGNILLNAGTSQDAYIWDNDNWETPLILPTGLMALSPDGSLIAGNGLRIFDVDNPTLLYPTEGLADPFTYLHGYTSGHVVLDATFSPDGRLIITAPATGGLMLWGIPE